jgi:hypothetical protein
MKLAFNSWNHSTFIVQVPTCPLEELASCLILRDFDPDAFAKPAFNYVKRLTTT